MEPLVLEIACREMRMTDGAVIDLKKKLRLARNDLARKRKTIAKLEVKTFYSTRDLCHARDLLAESEGVFAMIATALKKARVA